MQDDILAHVDTAHGACSHSAKVTLGNHIATRPRVVITRGSRACEQALIDDSMRRLDELGPQVLEHPLVLIVPSHSLRSHILERLASARGHSIAGLGCWTLHGFALEVLERLGTPPPINGRLLPILARRLARQEEPLRDCLDHLSDGYASVVGAVSDLLEAGLEPAHGEALEEALVEEGSQVASRAEISRACSLIRVAIGVREAMESLGIGHVSTLLQQASDLLRTSPTPPFPAGALLVHGFADATGLATDFLEVLLQRFGGTLFLDRPPDPTDRDRDDPGIEFSRRFSERLRAIGEEENTFPPELPSPRIDFFQALGTQIEIRETGNRIRELLDRGTKPESIGVVARQLEPYRSALRTHFWRLGIPFSAFGTLGPQHPSGRRIQALLDLVAKGDSARVDRWLDARAVELGGVAGFDLRLALASLGAGRLRDVAELELDRVLTGETYSLPVRHGYSSEDDGDPTARLGRRKIPTDSLRSTQAEAQRLCQLFASWKSGQTWNDHQQRIDELLTLLHWRPEERLLGEVQQTIDRVGAEIPDSLDLEFDELVLILTDALGGLGFGEFGGRGGGVQILDVIEARGRTFDHLFIVGLNKGIFPRTVREDPVLPDSLRQVLGHEGHGVLPDLPRKLMGYAEERFLFAQLLAASPQVTVSWQTADDDNRELTPSPLVERLLWSEALATDKPRFEPPLVGSDRSRVAADRERPILRTPFEHAVSFALEGSRRRLEAALKIAVAQNPSSGASWLTSTPAAPPLAKDTDSPLAMSRLRILGELDQGPTQTGQLGPYFGFLGRAIDPADPRLAQKLYITTLERFAGCPWRTFLERLLRLEALPDPLDVLPGLDPLLLGQLVHRSLERLVARQLTDIPNSLADALAGSPSDISWPTEKELIRIVQRQAETLSHEHGIGWEGFAAILAQVVLPFLEQARELTWNGAQGARPVAVELDCALELGTGSPLQMLHFKVDRLDVADTGLLLSDYKTGKTGVSTAKKPDTRARHLLREIRAGRLLQAVAYSQATGNSEDCGRYVFIRPDFDGPEASRIVNVEGGDETARRAFESAVGTLMTAWQLGLFFPRLVEADADKEPRPCAYCAMAEACLRGDSGARGRLRDWMHGHRGATGELRALLDTWHLASGKTNEETPS